MNTVVVSVTKIGPKNNGPTSNATVLNTFFKYVFNTVALQY